MDPFDLTLDAFQQLVPDPVLFGRPGAPRRGASDGNRGVQWNFWTERTTGAAHFSINLEGMRYEGWPVARFIQAELTSLGILEFAGLESMQIDPIVRFKRDAWQAQSKLDIEEQILGEAIPLSAMDSDTWRTTLEEALGCLDKSKSFKGRARQVVTKSKDLQKLEMQVSPHLNVIHKLWDEVPESTAVALEIMEDTMGELAPIHRYISDLASQSWAAAGSNETVEFSSLKHAAAHALKFAKSGSITHSFLTDLVGLESSNDRGRYTVNPRRFVWWDTSGTRNARLELKSSKLTLVVLNSLLGGVVLPEGSRPHKKNPAMTDCFTASEAEARDLLAVFE